MLKQSKFLSTTALATLLNTNRVDIFRKIKQGKIKATKIGRNFVIDANDLPEIIGKELDKTDQQKMIVAVKKTITDYGETLRLLGQE